MSAKGFPSLLKRFSRIISEVEVERFQCAMRFFDVRWVAMVTGQRVMAEHLRGASGVNVEV